MCLRSVMVMVLLVAVCLGIPVGQTQEDDSKARVQFVREHLQAGDVVQAVEAILRARSNSDPEPVKVVDALNRLTVTVYQAGEYHMGLELAQHTLAHAESRLGPDHPATLPSVNNLALLYEAQGRYGEAEPLCQRALASRERVLGADHPDTLISVNSLAFLYKAQGRYGEAEPLYQRALASHERVLGVDHPATLTSVNNMASLYEAQGRYGEAEPLYQRALASRERVLGVDHPATLTSVNNMASLYQEQERYGEAEPLYQRALASRERVLGADHPDTLISVNSLAGLYWVQGLYGEAEPLYQRALASRERVLGVDHPDTLASVNNLALLYQAQKRYDKAEPLSQRALAGCERMLGLSHPMTLTIQLNTAGVLVNLRQPRRALALLKRLEPHLWTFADTQLATTLQEQVRRQFLVSHSTFQDAVYTLALQPQASPEVMAFAADVLMRWKYIQGEDEAFMARLVRTSGDAAIQALGKDIMARRSALSHLANALAADATVLRSSHQALEARELELARLSQRYAQHRQGRSLGIDTIRAHLPRGSALLELRLYSPVDFTTGKSGPLHWLALLLPAVATEEQDFFLLDLGPVADSRDLWRSLRSQGDRDTAMRLYASLFGKLDDRLQGFEPLYIAPDGFVHVLALPRLVLPDGRYWVERQTLRQLQTGRDMLRLPPAQSPTGLLALGDITYGGLDTPAAGPPAIEPQRQELHRQLAQEIGTMRALAYSGVEVETIARYYDHPYRGAAQIWRGTEASEARLKALATPPRVLHLATHGFYLSHKDTAVARPMVLSGVALAGANAGMAGHASADGEDGILYALEAQSLNLEGTELVALSACDTGQGVMDYTEGVYGLVRAFRIAGARRVLMTLWPVNDALAKEFMTRFYWHWLQSDGEPAAALRQTRLEFLHHADPARRDPQVWAPYALVETR